MPEPVFNISPREAADSILSEPEESDDEVFGSQGFNRLPIPRLPEVAPAKGPAPYGPGPGGPAPAPGPGPSPYGAPPYGGSPAAPQYSPAAFNPPQPAPYNPAPAPQPYAPAPAANPFAPAPAGNPFAFDGNGAQPAPMPVPVPAPMPAPAPVPAAGPQGLQVTALDVNPFGGFDSPGAGGPAQARPTVVAAPAPVPAPMPMPAAPAPSNPWATLEPAPQQVAQLQPVPAPAAFPQPAPAFPQPFPAPVAAYPQPAPVAVQPAPQQVEEVSEAASKRDRDRDRDRDREPRPQRGKAPAAATGGFPKPVVYGLIGYAVLMTLLAIYGMFLRSPDLPADHPLSIIPDNFGEFDAAQRKKGAGAYRIKPDAPLPASQVAQLKGKIELGGLEIEPIRIEKRPVETLTVDSKGNTLFRGGGVSALVLHVKVKNNSDMPLCPFDPAFSRKTVSRDDIPFTRVVVPGSSDAFAGGPINWPFTKPGTRQYEREQEKDADPLKPNETREYSVCSTTKPELMSAIKKSSDRILWRIQVRRAPIEFRAKSIPVTAIFGVEFTKSEIDGL